jgi:hypothetical protein
LRAARGDRNGGEIVVLHARFLHRGQLRRDLYRRVPVIASARSLPARTSDIAVSGEVVIICASPEVTAVTVPVMPRYGTCTM